MTDEMSNFEKNLQSNPNVEKRSIPVYLIKDLDLLKRNPYNRKVSEKSVQKFMHLGVKPDVIYPVNQNGEILDGQHRIEACKRTGQPVLVQVLHETEPAYIRDINSAGETWKTKNFLDYACSIGLEDYIRLQNAHKKYPSINLTIKISVFSGARMAGKGYSAFVSFSKGNWKIRVSEKYTYQVFDFLTELFNNGIFLDIKKAYGTHFLNDLADFCLEFACLRKNLPFFKERFLRTLELSKGNQSKLSKKLHEHNNDFFDAFSDIASSCCRTNKFDYYGCREMFMQYLKAGQYL